MDHTIQTLPRTVYLIGYRPREYQIWAESYWLIAEEREFVDPTGALTDLQSRLTSLVQRLGALQSDVLSDANELVDSADEVERYLTVEWASQERKRLRERNEKNQQREPEFQETITWEFKSGPWPRFLTRLDEFGSRLPNPLPLCYRAGSMMSEALRRVNWQSMHNPYRYSIAEFEQLLVDICAEFPGISVSPESLTLEAFWQSGSPSDSFYSIWLRDKLSTVHHSLADQIEWPWSPELEEAPPDAWGRLNIDLESGQIEFDGKTWRVDAEVAAFFDELHKARGVAKTRAELARANPLLENFRWDRKKTSVPGELADLVRSSRGRGNWLEFPPDPCRSPAE